MKERLGLKVSRETLFSAAAGPALSSTRERSSFQASSQDRYEKFPFCTKRVITVSTSLPLISLLFPPLPLF